MKLWRNCDGVGRRDCLRLGLGTLFSGGLVGALRARAEATETAAAAQACILIWMDGGPTHYETFDPKPEAPVEIRGEYPEIATRLPGVAFSKHMQSLARIADRNRRKFTAIGTEPCNKPRSFTGSSDSNLFKPSRSDSLCFSKALMA